MTPNKSLFDTQIQAAKRWKLPAITALLLAAAATADAASYRYYRFQPTKLRGGGISEQFSEFQFFTGATKVTYPTGTVASKTGGGNDGNGEVPANVIDGNLATKWYNGGSGTSIAALIIDAGAGNTITADGYTYGTGNDSPERDPVSWTLEGSNDSTTWTQLDVRQNQTISQSRSILLPVFTIPAAPAPYFSTFTQTPTVVLNGAKTSLTYTAVNATSVTISPSIGTTLSNTSGTAVQIDPPDNADTTYTVTAASTQVPASPSAMSFPVRSVAGGASTYQYVRFTPLKSGGGIQLADVDFYSAGVEVPISAVTFDNGAAATGTEGPINLKDDTLTTKWFDGSLDAVVFDFGAQKSFDSYSFTNGADSGSYPGRNPTRWILEGRNDVNADWTLIENLSSFDFPWPTGNNQKISVPLPGASLAPIITNFYIVRDPGFSDTPTTAYFAASGAGKITIQAGTGPETEVFAPSFQLAPVGTQVYTLRVYSTDLSKVVSKTMTVTAPSTVVPTTISYPNGFAASSTSDFTFNGLATLIDDSFNIPLPGDVTRIRLTPDTTGVTGSAYFNTKVPVAAGFETTFYAHPTTLSRGYGAEGMAFVIQNTTDGLLALPANAEKGPLSNAYTIELSAWDNNAVAPLTLNEAMIRVLKGTGGTITPVTTINLGTNPAVSGALASSGYLSLTNNHNSAPYKVHIKYAGGQLSIDFNDVNVLSNFATDLGDAVDSDGKAWVGFSARCGGWTESADVTSWVLTSTSVTPATPLAITSYSVTTASNSATLNFSATPGTTYKATYSATLNGTDWTSLGTVTPTTTAGTITVTYPTGAKGFFRIEAQ